MPPEVVALFKTIWGFLSPYSKPAWEIIKVWWWVPLPFVLWNRFAFFWLWWKREGWLRREFRPCLLEIKIPKASLKPIRAMENVMAGIHAATTQPPDLWETWIDGQVQTSTHFEVASIGGEIHFYVRFHTPFRDSIESSIYAQYPDAEITKVDDYVKYVPQDIPNKDWDLFGGDYKLAKDDHYPIRTYTSFESESEAMEEKRIDPVSHLMEAMAKIKPGEQMWIQFSAEPISDATADSGFLGMGKISMALQDWIEEGNKIKDKLAMRAEKETKVDPMAIEAARILITGKPTEIKQEEKSVMPVEMKLTPGEKEILKGLEAKMSKPIFRTNIRFIFLGKKDVYFKPNWRLAMSFFNEYTTTNMNALFPLGKTFMKVKKVLWVFPNYLRPRRAFIRQRRMFRTYVNRWKAGDPKEIKGSSFMLTTEELASLYHFPSWIVSPVPGVDRVDARKGAPPDLPTEQ